MMVNEDVENRVINLAVRTTRITAGDLYKALRAYMRHIQNKKQLRQAAKDSVTKGKQSVKELVGQGQGVSSMEIGDSGIRDFKRIANKYGVDFAIVKDKNENPPKYTVFFKAKDADAITSVLKEYSDRLNKRKKEAGKERPSILNKLKKFKEIVANTPLKHRENTYKIHRDVLKDMIKEPDKKITPKAWQKELDGLKERYQKTERPLSDATLDLAKMEVLNHNKRDLERMLENESHKRTVSRDRNITL